MSPKEKSADAEVKEYASVEPEENQQDTQRLTVVTETDSYVSELMKGQPKSLTEVVAKVEPRTLRARMSLPDELEKMSYDCTHGEHCKSHLWGWNKDARPPQWEYTNRGQFIFRWLVKNKRYLDLDIGVRGWVLVNRQLFPSLKRHMISANGGVEIGNMILGFMSVEKALGLRRAPAERSQEFVKSRVKNVSKPGEEPRYLMSGEERAHQYMPQVGALKDGEEAQAEPGALVEGRDF